MFLSSFACEPAASNNSHNVHTLHKKKHKDIYFNICDRSNCFGANKTQHWIIISLELWFGNKIQERNLNSIKTEHGKF